VIPSSVIVLGQSSFMECKDLSSVFFGKGSRLERIEECAFRGSELASVVIPSSVIVLGQSSFMECAYLTSVIFGEGSRLERIEECAFRGSELKSIAIPASVTFVDSSAFDGTTVAFDQNAGLAELPKEQALARRKEAKFWKE
jgi:hypothetical protein